MNPEEIIDRIVERLVVGIVLIVAIVKLQSCEVEQYKHKEEMERIKLNQPSPAPTKSIEVGTAK